MSDSNDNDINRVLLSLGYLCGMCEREDVRKAILKGMNDSSLMRVKVREFTQILDDIADQANMSASTTH